MYVYDMDKRVNNELSITTLCFFRGRVGLHALLKAMGIGQGDQVAIQAFTCIAVPEAVMATGASPLYIDIAHSSFNMSADDLASKVTPKTRAIVVQHTFGIPADMECIIKIATAHGIPIIEDCCHTLASKYKGKDVGLFGAGSFYSYEWGKPLVAGVGGSIRVNDEKLAEIIKADYVSYNLPDIATQIKIELQYHAFSLLYRPSWYWPVRSLFHWFGGIGLLKGNYNPVDEIADDFSRRMSPGVEKRLILKIENLERQTQHIRSVSKQYREQIYSAAISHPALQREDDTIFARYPLLSINKQDLLHKARKANVELAEWYATPVHPMMGKDLEKVQYKAGSCPNAEQRCRVVVSLPTHQMVTQRDIDKTLNFMNNVG